MRAIKTLLLLGALVSPWVQAYTLEQFKFDSPEQAEEFRELLAELRCVVCQNETLAGSQADVAQIMREEVYRLTQDGATDTDVKAHLVERYGDFVLYRPPLKPSTYLLWFGPVILFLITATLLWRTLRSKKASPEAQLSEQEQARLEQLLDQPPQDPRENDK